MLPFWRADRQRSTIRLGRALELGEYVAAIVERLRALDRSLRAPPLTERVENGAVVRKPATTSGLIFSAASISLSALSLRP
jgi:hypothetical protein